MGKLNNLSNRIRQGIADTRTFGVFIALTNMLWPIIIHFPNALRGAILSRKKHIIDGYIERYCKNTIGRYQSATIPSVTITESSQAPIFVCWLQGEDAAPRIVKNCIQSIRQHAGTHPVHIISAANYSTYVSLPDYIVEAWQNNQIGNAHFADILRCALLCEHGGCWIDATIWMSGDIKDEAFEYPVYSCRFADDGRYITKNIWSNFFLAARPHSVTMDFVRDMFYEYLSNQTRFVDYFLMDYIIRWGYDQIKPIRDELENIPFNNESIHELTKCLFNQMQVTDVQNICRQTYLHKLSWRVDIDALSENSVGKTILQI